MTPQRTVKVAVVRGSCNAGLRVGDAFMLDGLRVIPLGHDRACSVAFATMVANIGRLALRKGPLFVSCPDPGTGSGGNVLLRLAREETP